MWLFKYCLQAVVCFTNRGAVDIKLKEDNFRQPSDNLAHSLPWATPVSLYHFFKWFPLMFKFLVSVPTTGHQVRAAAADVCPEQTK